MSTTIQAERPGAASLRTSLDHAAPAVPDHVPVELAAEHPDAAAVVSAARAPGGGAKVVDRPRHAASWARPLLGLACCAGLAALATTSGPPAASERPVETTPPAAATATVPATPANPYGCAPATPVVVRCEPPCNPTPFPLGFPACPSTSRTGW